MSEPFLILHRVRGEPAFDIAERMSCPNCSGQPEMCPECDDGFWWIIPTSGHRAYPYYNYPLREVVLMEDHGPISPFDQMVRYDPKYVEGLPDHYPSKSSTPPTSLSTIMSSILNTITPKLRR